MKKVLMILCVAVMAIAMTSCSSLGMVGLIYDGDIQPVAVTSNALGQKVGTATCVSVLGIVAVGDGGINAAAKNGGITKISHVDRKTLSVLSLFTKYEYFVYGE